jgi:small subunit ribosomal protein S17
MARKKAAARDIGIPVPKPRKSCKDKKCPFHAGLSVRGQLLEGVVRSAKMQNTVVVERERLRYVKKYERYERVRSRYPAHNPPCLDAKIGERVKIMECRPLSKTVAFVVVEVLGRK